jgi:ketosteroid isomerase-like protein
VTPEETLAVIQTALAAMTAGDLRGLLAVFDPDVELRSLVVQSARGSFHGHAGAREWWVALSRTYDESAIELEELRVDGDRAVTRVRASFTIGGVRVEHTAWQAARFSGRRFVWWARFDSDAEAGAAVDLPPGAGVQVQC